MERLAPIPDCYLLPTPVILIYEMKIISMFIEMLDTLDTAENVQHLWKGYIMREALARLNLLFD
jgi:hypothetical protein